MLRSANLKLFVFKIINKKAWIIPATIIIVAAIIRFYSLGVHSLWIDEGTSWYTSKLFSLKNLWVDRIRAGHFPFYFIFLKFWMMVFGDSEISLRFPSLIASIISLFLFFNINKTALNRNIARWVTLAIFSFSVYGLTISQEARMYSAALLFFLLLVFLLFKLINYYPKYSYLYIFSLAAFLLNGSVVIIPYLGILLFLLINFKNKIHRKVSFITIVTSIPFLPLYFLILTRAANVERNLYYLDNQFNFKSQLFNIFGWILRFFKDITGFSEVSFYNLSYNMTLVYFTIFSLFALIALIGLLKLSKEYRLLSLALIVTSLAPLFIAYKFESRYFFYLFPFMVIGWGRVIEMVSKSKKRFFLAFIILWGAVYINDTILYFKNPKSVWADISNYIEKNESPGDEIWLLPEFSLGAFGYYYHGGSEIVRVIPGGKLKIKEGADIWYLVWSNVKLPWVWGDAAIVLDSSLKRYLYFKLDLKTSEYFVTKNGEVELHHYKWK